MKNIVADNAKRVIREKKLKYTDVARKLGWAKHKLSRKLNGKWAMYWDDVILIADAIGVKPGELYERGKQHERTYSER